MSDPRWKRNALGYIRLRHISEERTSNTTRKSLRRRAKTRYFHPREEAGQRFSIDKSRSINDINEDVPISVITWRLRGYFINRFYSIVNNLYT